LNSQSKCVEVLLDRGANTDLQGKRGLTALMIAAYFNKLECIKIFLDRGANIDLKNKNGFTALDYAAIENNFECRKLLLSGLPIFSRLRYMVRDIVKTGV
ncbi:MAG: ankyrin repeat domain-containing protein, partial [Endozoicomonadaceae bacterium]|nr:ankyrin repeat domain-containing protein [Endozoicomonadaceae bacterium]